MLNLSMRDSRAVSYSDYYEEKRQERRISDWNPDMRESDLPNSLKNPAVGSETDVVKPFWKKVLTVQLVSGYNNGYENCNLGPKRPDIAFYPTQIGTPVPHVCVSFGDCKGDKWKGTSSAELGQGMLYAHRILDAQPQRGHVYGFITNNEVVVLIKGYRQESRPFGVYWEITPPLRFCDGMQLFFYYLRNENGYVSPPVVQNFSLEIGRALHPGSSCRAFVARYREQDIVAKLYKNAEKAQEDCMQIDKARRILGKAAKQQQLEELSLAVLPEIVALEGVWQLVSPIGTSFTEKTFMLTHLKRLLGTLKLIHAGGMIHRDVRPANFFLLDNNGVLLNDWGSAANRQVPAMRAGCPDNVCHPDLINAGMTTPLPKHDLYSLVVSVAELMAPGLSRAGLLSTFKAAIDAANCEDYDGVIQAFALLIS